MRRLLLLGLFISSLSTFAFFSPHTGDHRQEIQETLDIYFQANLNKDYDKILDMIYPRLFEIVSKEEMLGLFKQMESEGIDYSIKGAETTSISNRVVHNGEQYALVKYVLDIGIRFTGEEYNAPQVRSMMLGTFKAQYGQDRVQLDESTNTFWIKADNEMYAIAPAGGKEWKFLEKKPGMEAFVGDFVPKEVSDQLK